MQSYTREYLGKNQFWTPSSIGLTNSLIDNKLNNLDEKDTSGLLSKNEAENTYMKKTEANNFLSKNEAQNTYMKIIDAIVPKSHSFSLLNYGGNIVKRYIKDLISQGPRSIVEISIPENISGNIKIVSVDFRVISNNSTALGHLACSLNEKDGSSSTNFRFGKIAKGVCRSGDGLAYNFSLSDIFFGNISKLYLHFYFDNFDITYDSSSNEFYIAVDTDLKSDINVKIVSF